MTGPAVAPDPRILANLQRLKDAGAPDDALEAYLAEESAKPTQTMTPRMRQLKAAERARLNLNDQEQAAAETPIYGTAALGGLAALARGIPGVEALQAGGRSLLRGQPYTTALADIRGAEGDNPASSVASFAGSIPAAAAMPGSPVMGGAIFGGAQGLLGADPNTMGERVVDTAKGAAAGAASGKLGEWLGAAVRGLRGGSLGRKALTRKAAMTEADNAAYGAAATEGAAVTSTPQVVVDALTAPDIAPYVEAVRGSRAFAGADDATLLREAYKLLSEHQSRLANTMANATDFKAGTSLGNADVSLAKKQLLDAADAIMPSFRDAVAGHAAAAGERESFRAGADAAKRIANGSSVAAKKLETNSPEAFMASIKKMTPAQARAATEGLLARLNETMGLTMNPLKGFGLPKDAAAVNRLAPYLKALDEQAGNQIPSLFPASSTALGAGLLR